MVKKGKRTQKKKGGVKRSAKSRQTREKKQTRASNAVRPCTLISDSNWRAIAEAFGLSNPELEVLQRLFDGHQEAGAARAWGRSPHTVHAHLARIHKKIGVRSRTELLVRVFSEYLLLKTRKRIVAFRPGRMRLRSSQ